jgi:hypothetical protein
MRCFPYISFRLVNNSPMCFKIGSSITLEGGGTFNALATNLRSFTHNFDARVNHVATLLDHLLLFERAIVASL